ncbi:hypothetical protein CVT26_004413 [Gymnopilus dilepis]|uniref:ATP-citrate synthase citrate-binding domain-containing protein n=1 Tax=Gymnopilus dilepis TaxID=231916 RepID=A0A409WN84_9AGAR|nr:hypothetical protein CVT26_004413 [Gymnopilus dilepis]
MKAVSISARSTPSSSTSLSPSHTPPREVIAETLLKLVPAEKEILVDFLIRLYSVYVDLHFAYLEINSLEVLDGVDGGEFQVCYLNMAAKLDQTAESIWGPKWAIARDLSVCETNEAEATETTSKGAKVTADHGPPMVWPAPFGRIWTMVASGCARVVYSDAIAAHDFVHELANYDEYLVHLLKIKHMSAPRPPSTSSPVALSVTTARSPSSGRHCQLHRRLSPLQGHHPRFRGSKTNSSPTMSRPSCVLADPTTRKVSRQCVSSESLGVPICIFGPDIHMTESPNTPPPQVASAADPAEAVGSIHSDGERTQAATDNLVHFDTKSTATSRPSYRPFDANTRSFVYGVQRRAIQGVLDFD